MQRIIATRKSTLIGLLGGLAIFFLTALISHDRLGGLFNIPGLLMVLGGTLAATVVSRPIKDVVRVLRSLRAMLHDEDVNIDTELEQLLEVAHWYRSGNINAAEQALDRVDDSFLRNGAQLVIDREHIDDVIKIMQWRVAGVRNSAQGDVHILRTMASFAPAFGMLGTLLGLVQILHTLGHADLAQIGSGMSFALITTLYGIVLANMVFKPLAMKMERRLQHQMVLMNVVLEGIVLLHQRCHPTMIREALTAYLSQQQSSPATTPLLQAT